MSASVSYHTTGWAGQVGVAGPGCLVAAVTVVPTNPPAAPSRRRGALDRPRWWAWPGRLCGDGAEEERPGSGTSAASMTNGHRIVVIQSGAQQPRSHQDGGAPGRPPLPNVAIVKTHAGVAGGGGSPRATEGVEPLHAIVNNGSVGRRDLTTGCSPTGVPVLILSSTLGADGKRFAAHGCNQDRPATQSRVLARCEVVPSSVELRWRPVIVRLRGWPHHGGCCRIGCVLWEWWAGRCSTGPAQAGAARWILRRLNAVAARWASLRAAVRPRRENRSSSFLKFPIPGSAVAPRRV